MRTLIKAKIISPLIGIILALFMSAVAQSQDAALPDSVVTRAGMQELPEDLHARWISLKAQVDPEKYADYLKEGELVIKQLGELTLAVGGQPPGPDHPSYSVYADLQNKLLSILDRIELALILDMPDSELNNLLERYRGEKDRLTVTSRQERQRLIEEGTQLLKRHENDPYFLKYPHRRAVLADLYFRLTELLYAETYEQFLEETDQYIINLDSLSRTDARAAQSLIPPRPDYSRVMAMYQRIVDEFPTSQYADDALYNLGVLTSTGDTQGERAAANRLFEALVRIYPESPYKLNCLRRIGEFYFMPPVNDLDRAIEIYTQIANEFPNSEYYSEALYKLGWCYYRKSEIPVAVEHFALSLDAGYDSSGAASGTGLNIAKESINYIGVCFAVDPREWDGAGIENMAIWLQSNPARLEKYGREVIRQLGVIYRTQIGRYADAVEVYNKYLDMFPLDVTAPAVQIEIVEIYQSGEIFNSQAAHAEKIRFFRSYNPDSEWWKVHTDRKIRDNVVPTLERYIDLAIDETLVMASESRDSTLYAEFEDLSRQYLRFWPDGPNAYKIHYNLAGVLERISGKESVAIREYWQVATHYDSTSRKEISTQRVVAIAQELVKRERAHEIAVTGTGDVTLGQQWTPDTSRADTTLAMAAPADSVVAEIKQTPLLNSERLLLSGFNLYIEDFPQSELTPTMLYQGGDILYHHEWYPESRQYLEKLIADYPEHKFVEDAYKLILEGYFKSNDYVSVEKVAIRISENPYVSTELKDAAMRRKAESVFLTASGLKQGNDHLAAASEFKRVAIENPTYQYADRSLFQAGLEYMQGGAYAEANAVFLILADQYPTSEFADKSLYNIGFNLQSQINDLRGASEAYERLVRDYPKSELTQGALANASQNYNQIGDDRSAIRVNDLYVKMFPDAEDASVYLFENASHYMKLEEVDRANEIYRQFAQRYPDDPRTVQAFYERGKYSLDKGDRAAASREFTATLEAHQKLVGRGLGGSPRYASQSLNYLLIWEQEEYNKVRFTGNEAAIRAAKDRKKQWRNALVDKYQQLLRYGQKEAYRSYYAIGMLDEDFAMATYQQDVPSVKDLQGRIDALAKVVDEAIILNYVAQQSYRTGFENLRAIGTPLKSEQVKRRSAYDDFANQVAQMQKDSAAVGLPDSLAKLTAMQKALVELDSAVITAVIWSDSCRQRIPAVAILNGRYLTKLWYANFELRSNDKDEEVRLLFREEVNKNIIAVMAPEICGLYLQAWNEAKSVGLGSKWRQPVEDGYNQTVDSLIAQYVAQTNIAQARIDRLISDFESILPKGEDAKTSQGLYSDEIGGIILDQVDYLNTFNVDMLAGYRGVLDTVTAYSVPYGFGEASNDKVMTVVASQSDRFRLYADDAKAKQVQYSGKYDETGELQYDDAQVAFEDIGTNFGDYSVILLEEGLALRQDFNLSGMAGIVLTTKLVAVDPGKYGEKAGLSADQNTIATSTDWRIWYEMADGFQNEDFDDSEWKRATRSDYPSDPALEPLEDMNAKPIWYSRPVPGSLKDIIDRGAGIEDGGGTDGSAAMAPDTAGADTSGAGNENPTGSGPSLGEEVEGNQEAPAPSEDDLTYQMWIAPDSLGVRRYWFRREFEIDHPPSTGKILITADDNFSLYLNGSFVAEDGPEATDWSGVDEHAILDYLKVGKNVIAVEAADLDSTRRGLYAALTYEFVPDMKRQLASLTERESDRDRKSKEEALDRLRVEEEQTLVMLESFQAEEPAASESEASGAATEVQPEASSEISGGPTAAQLRDMRIIEKNKLR